MAKVRKIKRPIYRKTLNSEIFYKIFPDKTALHCTKKNLFENFQITHVTDTGIFDLKDRKKHLVRAKKQEFVDALRNAKKQLSILTQN